MRTTFRQLRRFLLLLTLLTALTATAAAVQAGQSTARKAPAITSAVNVHGGVQLRWNGGDWDGDYCVFRRTGAGAWKRLGTTRGRVYLDAGVRSGRQYTYTVRYVNGRTQKPTGPFDKAGRRITYYAAPEITKAVNTENGVQLSWGKVQGVVKYRVFRKSGSSWKPLGDSISTSFVDKTVKSGQRCTYTVRCLSREGKQYLSGYDKTGRSVTWYAPPVLTAAANRQEGITVRWKSVEGVQTYRVYRRTNHSGWKAAATVRGTSWTDRSAVPGQQYTYTVRCMGEDGKTFLSSGRSQGISAVRLTVPVLVSAEQSPRSAILTWKRVTGAGGYTVYRKSPGGSWARLAQTSSTQYTDTTVSESRDYIYTVRASQGTSLSDYDRKGIQAIHRDPVQQALSRTETGRKTDQIILVIDHNLTLWNRDGGGSWTKAMDVYCGYGKSGLRLAAKRSEGDMTTPIGAFPIPLAFGLGEDPGTLLPYRKITPYSYWSAERSTYNTWVESSTRVSGEHLMDYYQYQYAMVVGFNTDPVVYRRGSGIFLHCKSRDHWYTAGCVSVEEAHMLRLMRQVRPGAYIIIVPDEASLEHY